MNGTLTHTPPAGSDTAANHSPMIAEDSFRLSVLLLVGMTVAQRCIGLIRNILFCSLLEAHELGRWSVASNFLGWAAPFVVLGLPGSFGRLSEHYRNAGQLRVFLWRTGVTCVLLLSAALMVHVLFPSAIAKVVFNDSERAPLAMVLGIVLSTVVVMNFLTEFLTSVRLTRAVSLVHLTNSLAFLGLGVLLLRFGTEHEQSLLIAYGLSCGLAAAVGMTYATRVWRSLPAATTPERQSSFWPRVAGLAFWIWCGNTVANLFDVSDQLVLKHLSNLSPSTVDALLGQLYAGRVVPVLMVSIAVMVAGSLLPYLIKDAELGRHRDVIRRMNSVMKFSSVGFTLVAAVTHLASPILFHWILKGKYDSGLHLMPLAFAQYTWFSLSVIANKYLICTDRPRLGILPLVFSLLVGVSLTAALVPHFGLWGVVVATATANALALALLMEFARRCGMEWDRSVWLSVTLPVTLALGGGATLGIVAVVLAASLRADWLVNDDERRQIGALLQQAKTKWMASSPATAG